MAFIQKISFLSISMFGVSILQIALLINYLESLHVSKPVQMTIVFHLVPAFFLSSTFLVLALSQAYKLNKQHLTNCRICQQAKQHRMRF